MSEPRDGIPMMMEVAHSTRLGEVADVRQGMSTSGRGPGAQAGDWRVHVASVGYIRDDRLLSDELPMAAIQRSSRAASYLLHPNDVLITGRSTLLKVALVPPTVTSTVADASLLIVRPKNVAAGATVGAYLWWFLTSKPGRRLVEALMVGTTVLAVPARDLAELPVPWPGQQQLQLMAELVATSERAYGAAVEAAQLRRTIFRDAIISGLWSAAGMTGAH